MDLTGRTPGYRGAAIRCPGCAESMTQQALEECEVDLCSACGGLWIDWFDGEVRQVTAEALGAAPVPPTSADRPSRSEAVAVGACPRCTRQLVAERYKLDEKTTGAELLRCEDCLGVFVAKSSAEMLAALPPEDEPPPSQTQGPEVLDPLPWQRFLMVLKRALGLAE
jgi:Zn-finger nucleic acid-binding protein